MELDTTGMLGLALLVALSFGVEATAGFGSTVVALSIGAAWLPLDALLAVLVPVNLLVSAILIVLGWRQVVWRSLGSLIPTVGLGMVGGLALQHQLASEGLRLLFAGFVVVLSSTELWRLRRGAMVAALPPRRRVATLLSAGVIHGLFATGGPLVVYALGREIEDKSAFRSTLAVLWILTSTVLLLDMVASGKVGWAQLELGVWMLLPMGLGMVIGGWVHQRVSQKVFREGVYALLIVVGMSLLVRAWLGT